jgi:hypothetical protein
MSIFIVDLAEGLTSPLMDIAVEKLNLKNVIDNNFIITFPSRIFELILLLVIYSNNFKVNNYMFDKKWKLMKKTDIITIFAIYFIIMLCYLFNSNNVNLYIKLHQLNINLFIVEPYLKINLFIPLVFMLI